MTLREQTEAIRERGEKALVPFLTAGFPDEETFLRLLTSAAQAGCDVIEIGIPFSDPIADGPVIQESSQQALANGMSLSKALKLAARASATNSAALVIMSYFNPILQMGIARFAARARGAGVAGVIVPDVPFEESPEIRRALNENGVAFVDFIAPTSGSQRIARIARAADGFLYLVSLTGVTGVRAALSRGLGDFVARVRAETGLPLYVGFGVSNRAQAGQVTRHADGVIIGSALIKIIQAARTNTDAVEQVGAFLAEIKQAIEDSDGS